MSTIRRGATVSAAVAVLLALIGLSGVGATADAGETAAGETAADCTPLLTAPVPSPAYARTPWPTEHADPWRTHAAATGLPADVARVKLRTASVTLPQEPVWGYAGTRGKLYVIGGSPYLLDMFTKLMQGASPSRIPTLVARTLAASRRATPYVARIDTRTMRAKVLRLTRGTAVNYTGGLLVHANGHLYAVVQGVLYKIDPARLAIVASRVLPLAPGRSGPNRMTTYNGIVAAPDGDLILKGWASSGGGDDAPGMLLRVDPDDLSFEPNLVSGISSARLAIVESDGGPQIYLPGPTQSVRFSVGPASFLLDDTWTAPYRDPASGDTMASSSLFMGKGVLFADNTDPQATTPMRVFARGVAPADPLRSTQAFSGGQAGWNFFMMAGDPYRSGVAAVQDQASGHVAGYLACDGGTSVVKLWENDRITSSAGMAINHRAGHLYTDDRDCSSARRCRVFLVVLDLRTGRELARVRVKATKPSMGQIFIAPGAVHYVAAQTGDRHGFVTRITAAPR